MGVRLGDLLIKRGAITEEQRESILEHQRRHPRPFGLLAEQLFGVSPRTVEQAWAEQFAEVADWVELDGLDTVPDVLDLIDRRQAWQFGVVPLYFDSGELAMATSKQHLARAMRFAGWRIEYPCRFVLCSSEDLHNALSERYPMAGIDAEFLEILSG
ncbi:MAG: hypothetical protein AAGI53_05070 [Planctomycetota bacterium]